MTTKKTPTRTFSIISLGCPKNLVDSERMAGLLLRAGYRRVDRPDGADLAVVNTCGFIDDARTESYAAIEEMVKLKRRGRLRRIIVAGCLAERDREELLARYTDVDHVLGVFARDEIASVDRRAIFCPAPSPPLSDSGRCRLTLSHLAYLKIAEGCNRLCSFCTIPRLRGPYASKPIEQVAAEAEELVADGARELVLVAQDTTFYGIDADGRPRLAALLKRLDAVEGLTWIRLMYLYPMHVTDELIDVLAGGGKIVPYLDIPLQHVNDEVLRRMRRQVDRRGIEKLLDRLRRRIEGLVLRTTMMTGFPGETEEQFEELLDFVRRQRFERLGAFAFRNEPGTAAAKLDGHLDEAVKRARRDRLMQLQQELTFAWNAEQVGRRLDVMIDAPLPDEHNVYLGRSYADAPEVDGQVYVTGENLSPGQIVNCEIVATEGYDLVGIRD